jgi:hypothetical protein
MIKFFRKIRQSLLLKGNTGKYLKYAIGEIILVVIGILIALSINNWNEDRKKQKLINNQLLNLATSMKADSSMWNGTIEMNEFRSSSFEYLLKKADQSFSPLPDLPKADSTRLWKGPYPNPDITDINFIKNSFSWLTNGLEGVRIDRTGINEINNLGLFSEIKNDKLKTKIRDYYLFLDFQFGDDNIRWRTNRSIGFYEYIRDNYTMVPIEVPDLIDPIEFIKNDKGIVFRLKEARKDANYHALKALDAMNLAHEIIEMIEHEVGH